MMSTSVTGPAGRVALLTAPGAAGIAVTGLVGPADQLRAVISAVFRPRSRQAVAWPLGDRVIYGDFAVGGVTLDDGVICAGMPSRDGESIELHTHGSPAVVAALLAAAREHGFAVSDCSASPPQSIADELTELLPRVRTWRAVEILAGQVTDGLTAALRAALTSGTAPTGVVDFSVGRFLVEPPTVAIVGRPNVGKSTLANALFGRPVSVVTELPGTTRDVLAEPADFGGFALRLADTAGRRATTDAVEAEGVRRAVELSATADVVLAVFDGSAQPGPADTELLAELAARPRVLRVINKVDLPVRWPMNEPGTLAVSAHTGAGLDALRNAVLAALGLAELSPRVPIAFTARQARLLQAATPAAWRALLGEPNNSG